MTMTKEKLLKSSVWYFLGRLYHHMTNFVACNHWWHMGRDLFPYLFLQVECTDDQRDLLNTTIHDVQIGAILDQCTGKKAKKVIANHRIKFVSGNINSYAPILNGLQQLEQIQLFNDLSSSILILQKKKQEEKERACKITRQSR